MKKRPGSRIARTPRRRRQGRPPVEEITEPQQRTLEVIRALIEKNGFPPTVKELGEVLGITPASVHDQLKQLERKGYITREARKARSIVVCANGSRSHTRNSRRKRDA